MFLCRKAYLKIMKDIVCIYYHRTEYNVARIEVHRALLRKTHTQKHTKEKKKHDKVDTQVETKETVTEITGYQIIAKNRADPTN